MSNFRYRPWHWIAVALLMAPIAGGCTSSDTAPPEVTRPVKTLVVVAGEPARTRTFPGKADASKRVELAFQVAGLLVELPIKEGQMVAKGEVIARLRQDEFEARLNSLQGDLDQARARLTALRMGERPEEQRRRESQVRAAEARMANARAEFERSSRLVQSSAVSRSMHEQTETAYRISQEEYESARQLLEKGTIGREEDINAQEAQVRALEGRVVEANIQLTDSTLRAPYDGVIARRLVEQNQNIRAQEPVVQFQDVDEIEISVDVPEAVMAADLRAADIVQLVAEFSGAPGLEFPVHIREIAQTADPMTQTFQVRVAMQAPSEARILPGMSATVSMTYRRANILGQRLLVPSTAITTNDRGESIAWIVGDDQTVRSQPVQLGEALGGEVEITKGLAPGQRIAIAGVTFLREGMKVRDLGDELGGRQP